MQMVHLPENPKRTFQIAIDIGQYHFIDWQGWHIEWSPLTPREWWAKQQWLKEGGYEHENQDCH